MYVLKDGKGYCPKCDWELPILYSFIICENPKCDWWIHVY